MVLTSGRDSLPPFPGSLVYFHFRFPFRIPLCVLDPLHLSLLKTRAPHPVPLRTQLGWMDSFSFSSTFFFLPPQLSHVQVPQEHQPGIHQLMQGSGAYSLQPKPAHRLCLSIKLHRNTVKPICLPTVYGCFHTNLNRPK